MIILIAEAKTMTACDTAVAHPVHPVFDDRADDIMASLRDMSAAELAVAVKISPALATRLRREIYDFPLKNIGSPAIRAFTGVVFKAFDYDTLDAEARAYTSANVRILSSLYGYLRPDDTIKAYRLDYTTRLAPGGKTFAAYWRYGVTHVLLDDLRAGGHTEVLNLLPADAAKMLDFKALSAAGITIRTPDLTTAAGRTPHAALLKTLRGTLLRNLAQGDTTIP